MLQGTFAIYFTMLSPSEYFFYTKLLYYAWMKCIINLIGHMEKNMNRRHFPHRSISRNHSRTFCCKKTVITYSCSWHLKSCWNIACNVQSAGRSVHGWIWDHTNVIGCIDDINYTWVNFDNMDEIKMSCKIESSTWMNLCSWNLTH